MSSETHAFKQKLLDELAKAHAAIGEIEKSFEAVVDKYEHDTNLAQPTVDNASARPTPNPVENTVKPDGGNLPPKASTTSK